MKKVILASAIAALISTPAFAGDDIEIEKISADFDSLDNNDDGYISMEEADDNNIWEHFAAIDTDGDSTLSTAEYDAYLELHKGMVAEEDDLIGSGAVAEVDVETFDKIDSDFESLDNDEDGYISMEEADDDDISNHFSKIDTDADDRVSEEEFKSYVHTYGNKVAEDDVLEVTAR